MSISKPQNILSIQSRDEFRQWLMTHHATARECWVKVKRGRPVDDGTFWYIDAVEEAMCFGWIDSTLKRLDGVSSFPSNFLMLETSFPAPFRTF